MQFKNFIFILSCISSSLFAMPIVSHTITCCPSAYVLVGSGVSFSREPRLSINLALWDPANQGYQSSLQNSVLYTLGLGFDLTPYMDVDFELTSRPSFHYSKFQTPVPGASTPGALGTKTRKFDFDNVSALVNVYFNGRCANLFYSFGPDWLLQPFIGAGLGISYNTISNFRSVRVTSSIPGSFDVASIMTAKTKSAFAWQLMIGLEVLYGANWGLDLAYRYFDGGNFKTNDYLTSAPTVTVTPWEGQFSANEVFLHLKYYLR